MKKITVTTQQTILQGWEYEIEVPDDFNIKHHLDFDQDRIFEIINKSGVEGHCLDDDFIEEVELRDVCED